LFLGRLAPQKGLMWLLRAFAAVETDAHLDIAGEGTLLDAAQTFVQQSGLTDRVTFHGWVEADAVPALMAAARAVVFPSIWHEPAGLVSLEAAAHGRALIASRVGGIPEYAAPLHALLVPPNDTLALARAITDLAQAPDRADRLGRLGRAAVTSCFALDHFLDRLDLEYQLVRPAPTRASRLSLVTSR
jgi:glycosyltransferase involved in cell wall biosynthesis